MSDRVIFRAYEEDKNGNIKDEGYHDVLRIERSAAGPPGVFITVENWDGGLHMGESTFVTTRTQEIIDVLQEWVNRG